MKIRYVGDEDREVSILPTGDLRGVTSDAVFDVPDEHVASYACQPHFYQPADGSEWPEPEPDPDEPEPEPTPEPAEPDTQEE